MNIINNVELQDVGTYGNDSANLHGSNAIAYDKSTERTYIAYRTRNSSDNYYCIYVAYSTDMINWTKELVSMTQYVPYRVSLAVDNTGRVCLAYSLSYSPFATAGTSARNIVSMIKSVSSGWLTGFGVTNLTNHTDIVNVLADKNNVFHYTFLNDGALFEITEGDASMPVTSISTILQLSSQYYMITNASAVYDETQNAIISFFDTPEWTDMSSISFGGGIYYLDTDINYQDYSFTSVYTDPNITNWDINSISMSINDVGKLFAVANITMDYNDGFVMTKYLSLAFYQDVSNQWQFSNTTISDLYDSSRFASAVWSSNSNISMYYIDDSYNLIKIISQDGGSNFDGLNMEYVYSSSVGVDIVTSFNISNDPNMISEVCLYNVYNIPNGTNMARLYSSTPQLNIDIVVDVSSAFNTLSNKSVNVSIILVPPTITSVFKSGSSIIIMWEQRW